MNRRGLPTATLGLIAAAIVLGVILTTTGSTDAPVLTLGLYALLFAPYLALVWRDRATPNSSNLSLGVLVLGAIIIRAIMCVSDPLFSDDIYRYVWDGRVALDGINPYVWAPDASALAHLRDDLIWPKINHPEIPTIYPPAAQRVFELNAWLGGAETSLRGLFVLLEALALGASAWLLSRGQTPWSRRRFTSAFILYAYNPLVYIEGIWSGHIDIMAWSALAIGVIAAADRRSTWSSNLLAGLGFGVSIAAKLIGVIALPIAFFAPKPVEQSWPQALARRAAMIAASAVVVAVSYAPYLDAGPKLFTGFGAYASRWRGNDGAFRALTHLAHESLDAQATPGDRADPNDPNSQVIIRLTRYDDLFIARGWTKEWEGRQIPDTSFAADQISQTIAKLVVAGLMGLALLWALLVIREPGRGVLYLFTALFFLAPTLYPWYVAWLVPLAALRPARTPILFSLVCLAAYFSWVSFNLGGEWAVPNWAVTIEFGAVALFALYEALTYEDSPVSLSDNDEPSGAM